MLKVKNSNGSYRDATKLEVLEAATSYRTSALIGKALKSPEDSVEFLNESLASYDSEVFGAVFMDARHRVIAFEILFKGTIDGTSVYPREVVKRALELNAAAIILTHNHPSGKAEPSTADERITTRLKNALELIDVRVLDHIIICRDKHVSMAKRGLL